MGKTAILLIALAFSFFSCQRQTPGIVTHRTSDGRADQWLKRIDAGEYQVLLDTNGDQRPDVIKTYRNGQLVQVERDRNFNGAVDLVQQYSQGQLVREVHDDDFDGKPESIWTFRNGKVAMVERDPQERGYVDVVEYYDDSGKLTHREVRSGDRPLQWTP